MTSHIIYIGHLQGKAVDTLSDYGQLLLCIGVYKLASKRDNAQILYYIKGLSNALSTIFVSLHDVVQTHFSVFVCMYVYFQLESMINTCMAQELRSSKLVRF